MNCFQNFQNYTLTHQASSLPTIEISDHMNENETPRASSEQFRDLSDDNDSTFEGYAPEDDSEDERDLLSQLGHPSFDQRQESSASGTSSFDQIDGPFGKTKRKSEDWESLKKKIAKIPIEHAKLMVKLLGEGGIFDPEKSSFQFEFLEHKFCATGQEFLMCWGRFAEPPTPEPPSQAKSNLTLPYEEVQSPTKASTLDRSRSLFNSIQTTGSTVETSGSFDIGSSSGNYIDLQVSIIHRPAEELQQLERIRFETLTLLSPHNLKLLVDYTSCLRPDQDFAVQFGRMPMSVNVQDILRAAGIDNRQPQGQMTPTNPGVMPTTNPGFVQAVAQMGQPSTEKEAMEIQKIQMEMEKLKLELDCLRMDQRLKQIKLYTMGYQFQHLQHQSMSQQHIPQESMGQQQLQQQMSQHQPMSQLQQQMSQQQQQQQPMSQHQQQMGQHQPMSRHPSMSQQLPLSRHPSMSQHQPLSQQHQQHTPMSQHQPMPPHSSQSHWSSFGAH